MTKTEQLATNIGVYERSADTEIDHRLQQYKQLYADLAMKSEKLKRVVIYARVSDKTQLEGASLETQIKRAKEYVESRGWKVAAVYQEQHTGAEYRERKILSQVRAMVRSKEVDVVLVNSLDRLSRDMIHQAVLIDEMTHYGVVLDSVTEDIDNSPVGNFMRQALGFAAAIEREKIIERGMRGRDNKVNNGYLSGQGIALYGYKWGKNGKGTNDHYEIDPKEGPVVTRVFQLYIGGMSAHQIVELLIKENVPTRKGGSWSISSVSTMLGNPFYCGEGWAKKVNRLPNGKVERIPYVQIPTSVVPPLVTKEDFYKAQMRLAINKQESSRRNSNPYEFLLRSGFIVCGYCGRKMHCLKDSKIDYVYYRCRGSNARPCKGVTVEGTLVDNATWAYIGELLEDLEPIIEAVSLLRQRNEKGYDVAAIDRSIARAKKEQELLAEDIIGLRGNARLVLLQSLQELDKTIEGLENEKAKSIPLAEEWDRQQAEIDGFLAWAEDMRGRYQEATYEEKRRALRVLGIQVQAFRSDDTDNERYTITVSLPDTSLDESTGGCINFENLSISRQSGLVPRPTGLSLLLPANNIL